MTEAAGREPAGLDLPTNRTAEPLASRPSRRRAVAKWVMGSLLVLDLLVLFFALSFAHVTAEGPAKRGLRQSIAILTEIDAYLDEHRQALREQAAQAPSQGQRLAAPDFPVAVTFSAQEVLSYDRDGFRALLLSRAAEQVHDDGVSVLHVDQETDDGFFSLQGAVRNGMNFLRPHPHNVLTVVTLSLAVLASVLALGLVVTSRGFGRLLGLGVSVSLAALPFLVLAIAVRFALRLAADSQDDYLAQEFLALGQELTWAPIRNGIIFSVGGGALLLLGATLALWWDRRYAAL